MTVAAEIGRGRPDLAERQLDQRLALDPLSKEGDSILVRAVIIGGSTVRLAVAMDTCRRTVTAHVSGFPFPETDRLYAELTSS